MFKRFYLYLRHLFGFSRTESNGFIVLSCILLASLAAPVIYRKVSQPSFQQYRVDQSHFDSLITVLDQRLNPPTPEITPSPFDPNQASLTKLEEVGIPSRLAQRIVNYREKGGRFRIRKDLQKIYGFPDTLYAQLADYIELPENYPRREKKVKPKLAKRTTYSPPKSDRPERRPSSKKEKIFTFDLNTVDSLSLQVVSGIGPVLAGRIVKYRQRLGGFVHAGQLDEVYGLKPETQKRLLEHGYIKSGFSPQLIDLDTISITGLSQHPYISYKQAKLILAYRRQHGKQIKLEELTKIPLIDSTLIFKMTPYLKIN